MPTLLVHNARVLTMDPARPTASAVVIRGGTVALVGDEREAAAAAGPGATTLDAGGCTVLPGFVDPHNHLLSTAESLAAVDAGYPRVTGVGDLVAVLAAEAARTGPGQWIRAFGMDDAKYPEGRPNRRVLDEATTEHPVIVYHVSGHQAVVNSAALRLAGVSDSTPDPAGGQLVRDEGGRLTGMVLDSAMQLLLPVAVDVGCHGPNFHTDLPADHLLGWLREAAPAYLSAGLTTVCDPQVSARELRIYRAARDSGRLPLRTVGMPLSHQLDALTAVGLAGPFGDDWLRLAGMKFYSDGTLLGGTAAFSTPYGRHDEFTGSLYWAADELTSLVTRAAHEGWQIAVHAQGDRAIGHTLDAIAAATRGRDDLRPRIEHCGHPTPAQTRRFTDLGLIPVNQPNFLHDSGGDFLRRLGPRAHRLQPMREELDLGLRPALSSDAFVSSLRPMDTVTNAVRRTTREGDPIGADQAISLHEALRAHTTDAAHAIGMEDRIGMLRPGMLADVVVLDQQLFTTDIDRLDSVRPQYTILDGRIVFDARYP